MARAPLIELGTALTCGFFAALLGAGPAALRLEGARLGWWLMAAIATPITVLAILILREAHEGLRAMTGGNWSSVRAFVSAVFVIWAPAAFALAATLGATTHHRPLGGVTFALAALALFAFAALVARRLVAFHVALHDTSRALHNAAGAVLHAVALVLLFAGVRLLHDKLSATAASLFIDVTALTLASALGARHELSRSRRLAVLSPPLLVVIAVLLVATPRDTRTLVTARSPTFAPLLGLVP